LRLYQRGIGESKDLINFDRIFYDEGDEKNISLYISILHDNEL